jgi:nucleotide-binding universal stress UspA family protein
MPDGDNNRRAAAAESALRRAYGFVPAELEVSERIVPSSGIAAALVELARDVDACALTVGRDTEAHVTRSLIPRAPCPVAVAPLSVPLPHPDGFDRIGVAFDGSETAYCALVAAARLAHRSAGRLVVLVAGPTMARADHPLQVARLALARSTELPELRALVGEPSMTLTQASDDLDLLLCGSRGLRRPLAAMLGSVSSHLVEHARCPVLVVPPAASRSRQTRLGLAAAGSTS